MRLVLGLGNPLSGADGFGPAVIEALRRRGVPPDVTLVDAHTDLLAHLDRFAASAEVVLVDAALADIQEPDGRKAGVVTVGEEEFSAWDTRSAGVHEFCPVAAVKLYRILQRGRDSLPPITLVALLVSDRLFNRAPTAADIAAGEAAVLGILAAR